MTPEQLAQFAGVNAAVNRIPYDALPAPGEPADWWSDAPVAGRSWVCRDYVLMKADRLKALGWPAAALTVVLCWTETGDYHAVLAVAADGDSNGDAIILDSRFARTIIVRSVEVSSRNSQLPSTKTCRSRRSRRLE